MRFLSKGSYFVSIDHVFGGHCGAIFRCLKPVGILAFTFWSFCGGVVDDQEPSLLTRNPFKAMQTKETATEAQTSDLSDLTSLEDIVDYRGSYKLNNQRRYSLFFKESGSSRWLVKNDTVEGVQIVDSVENDSALVLMHNGNEGVIKLNKPTFSGKKMVRSLRPASGRNPRQPMERPGIEATRPPEIMPGRVPNSDFIPPPPPMRRTQNSLSS